LVIELQSRLNSGESPSRIAKEVAKEAQWAKKEVYSLLLELAQ
jgi:hypothetical protein